MLFEDSQVWLMIGIIVGSVALLSLLAIMVNAYITARRLANVLSDLEEVMHADFAALEAKVDAALTRIRVSEAKANRE